jgi:hypothetical protein
LLKPFGVRARKKGDDGSRLFSWACELIHETDWRNGGYVIGGRAGSGRLQIADFRLLIGNLTQMSQMCKRARLRIWVDAPV